MSAQVAVARTLAPRERLERTLEFVASAHDNLSDYWLCVESVRRNFEAYEKAPIPTTELTKEERFELEEVKSFLARHAKAKRRPRRGG